MSLRYEEILADNYFGQVILPASDPNKTMPSSTTDNNQTMADEKKSLSLIEEFGFPLDELFNMARHFLKGKLSLKKFFSF
jgi:hypothetical protein